MVNERQKNIEKIFKENTPDGKFISVVKTSRPNLIRRLYDNMTIQDFISDTNIDYERYKKVDSELKGINLNDILQLSKKYDISLDYLYGISKYKNDEDVFFKKLLEHIPEISTRKKDYIELSINHYLIDYIIGLYNLEETSDWEDYTEYEYETSKQQEYVNTYKKSVAESQKLNDEYILISKKKFDELLNNKNN